MKVQYLRNHGLDSHQLTRHKLAIIGLASLEKVGHISLSEM
jgi:hypothetical protein